MVKRRRKSKKWIFWVVFLILMIAAGIVGYLVWDNYFNDKKEDVQEADTTKVDQQETEGSGENEVELVNEGGEEKKIPQYDGEDPNKASELSGAITYSGVVDGKLMIRMNIDQYLSNGKCELTLKRSGATIYNSVANIVGNASTSSCEGFDVPTSGLGGGNTEIIINLTADGKSGIIRGEVNI